jgi:hypothetical protein
MSHAIDFDGMQEKLFLLRHLSLGSKAYCREEEIGSDIDIGEGEFDSYWGWLKVVLSNYLIESAVKLRMIQEYCAKDGYAEELASYERTAMKGLSLGTIHQGSFTISVRETTNKIIHATRATIAFTEEPGGHGTYRHWDGYYHLYGKKGSADWHLALDVNAWSKAVSIYLDELQSNELTLYMGQDWA